MHVTAISAPTFAPTTDFEWQIFRVGHASHMRSNILRGPRLPGRQENSSTNYAPLNVAVLECGAHKTGIEQ